jgi:hypothetical protein
MAIYDTMESIKSPVGTLALGYAYNNAGFLLGAGAKVHRPPADFYKAVSRLTWLSMNFNFLHMRESWHPKSAGNRRNF